MSEMLGGIGIFGILFLVVLAVLWFFLPFAVFGIKERLDNQIKEQKKTNELLIILNELLAKKSEQVIQKLTDEST